MKLEFIALSNLSISKANMRYARKAPDVSDILPTIRARGVIQPILVRPNCEPGQYEIVAGCRRYHAAKIVAAERLTAQAKAPVSEAPSEDPAVDPAADLEPDLDLGIGMMPCAVLGETDDAAATEASLIENLARLDPDEVARWECFTRLVREGRGPEQIARTFGLPDLAVRRILALGNLLPRIREMYRRQEIDAATIRHLTLASKRQQKAWLALVDDANAYVPRGHQLKSWLFSGQSIPARHALFDVEASGLATVADLFGEDAFFVDGDAFWALQNAEIEARRCACIDAGWADAVVVAPDSHFHVWEYEKTAKRKGGRVYLDVRANGEVIAHEGYLGAREAARLARAGQSGQGEQAASGKLVRPELTSVTQTYVDLHRHAALRAALLPRSDLALRLMAAHVIAGSALWRVAAEPQAVRSDAVRESLDESRGEALFDERRRAVLALLELPEDEPTVVAGNRCGLGGSGRSLCSLFARLVALSDGEVMDVIAVVMGETLAAGSPAIEAVGLEIGLSMADWWQADEAFLDTLRDREVLLAMVADVAGPQVAAANAGEKGKGLKAIIRDHLAGAGGRVKREGWVPRWMAFPPSAYTPRAGVGTVAALERARGHDAARGGRDSDEDGDVDGCAGGDDYAAGDDDADGHGDGEDGACDMSAGADADGALQPFEAEKSVAMDPVPASGFEAGVNHETDGEAPAIAA